MESGLKALCSRQPAASEKLNFRNTIVIAEGPPLV